jgi:hypothetical protein
MGGGVALLGLTCVVISGLVLLWKAFSASLLWGLGCLFVPLVGLFFVATHWHETKTAFLLQIVGWVIFFAAGAMAPDVRPGALLLFVGAAKA